jgi:hypothetical protein
MDIGKALLYWLKLGVLSPLQRLFGGNDFE